MECSRFHVSKVMGGNSPLPSHWAAVLELLELVPADQRPLRWKK